VDYEYYYNNARSRYYNACAEINGCEGRAGDLRAHRQQLMDSMNRLKSEITRNQEALEGVAQAVKAEDALAAKGRVIANRTSSAAAGFTAMAVSTSVRSRSIEDAYRAEMAATRRALESAMGRMRAQKAALAQKVADLEGQLHRAESDLHDVEAQIRSTESDLQYWCQQRTGASYDMEYYRRKINEAA
jgi:peptidoglycan hydrolase CwlO-like protein